MTKTISALVLVTFASGCAGTLPEVGVPRATTEHAREDSPTTHDHTAAIMLGFFGTAALAAGGAFAYTFSQMTKGPAPRPAFGQGAFWNGD